MARRSRSTASPASCAGSRDAPKSFSTENLRHPARRQERARPIARGRDRQGQSGFEPHHPEEGAHCRRAKMRHPVLPVARPDRSRRDRRQSEAAAPRGAIDLAVEHRRRGGNGATASRHRGSAGHHRGDRRSHLWADARDRAADDGRRPPRAGGKISRRAVELPARLLRLGQDDRPRRRRRSDRPRGGAACARLLHARALLDAAAQAREPGTRGRPDLRSTRPAARRIRFRLAAFAAQRRRRGTRSGRASSS